MEPDALLELEARIRGLNPYARLHRTERAQIALEEVLGRNAFDLDRILDIEPHSWKPTSTTMTTIIITIIATTIMAPMIIIMAAVSSTTTTKKCNRCR